MTKKSKIKYVIIDGNVHQYEANPKKEKKKGEEVTDEAFAKVLGTWSYSIDADGMIMKGELEITEEDGSLTGTMTGDQMPEAAEIDEINIDGDEISFATEVNQGMEIELTATVADDEMEGSVRAGDFGTFPIIGSRISTPE